MKKTLLIIALAVTALMLTGGDLFAQVATAIKVEAMTPHRLEKMNIENPNGFDAVSSGLKVVGKGTWVYLSAWNYSDPEVLTPGATYLWELLSKPANSAAALDTTTLQWTVLHTDSAGTYTVKATVDGKDTSISIIATNYAGADRNSVDPTFGDCLSCHSTYTQTTKWSTSGHATLFENGMNGTLSDHWGPACFPCHTTGFNKSANNGGWDDVADVLGWVDTQWAPWRAGLYDSMLTTDKAKLSMVAGVGCESCHGPKNLAHPAPGSQPKPMSAGVCGQCHDEPWRHNIYSMYENSAHAEAIWETGFASSSDTGPITNFTLSICVRCHDGGAFVEFTKGGSFDRRSPGYNLLTKSEITCQTCHDPHDGALRVAPAQGDTLGNGYNYSTTNFGNGKICVNCHKYRRNSTTYVTGNMSNTWGPHYRGAGDIFLAENAVTFGDTLPKSIAHSMVPGTCVGCHMSATPDTGTVGRDKIGGHSWNMEFHVDSTTTLDNVSGCVGCHSGITEFSDIVAAFDYDADGTNEPFQREVEGLLGMIDDILPPAGPGIDRWLVASDPDSVNLKKVFFNYLVVKNDNSYGVHNPKYVIALLQKSLEQVTDVDFSGREPIPTEFLLTQNYPNPFNPTTSFKVGLAKGTNVVLTVYNVIGEEVVTLMDGQYAPGVYDVSWDGKDASGRMVAGGIYLYRIQTAEFTSVRKMVYLK